MTTQTPDSKSIEAWVKHSQLRSDQVSLNQGPEGQLQFTATEASGRSSPSHALDPVIANTLYTHFAVIQWHFSISQSLWDLEGAPYYSHSTWDRVTDCSSAVHPTSRRPAHSIRAQRHLPPNATEWFASGIGLWILHLIGSGPRFSPHNQEFHFLLLNQSKCKIMARKDIILQLPLGSAFKMLLMLLLYSELSVLVY